MTTHTEDQDPGQAASDAMRRGISRRTALKAAAATGAAIYAIPAIDTLTAHAAGVSTFKNNNVFIQTCGGSASFTSPYGSKPATISIAPTAGCSGNAITITDSNTPSSPGAGTATTSIQVGTTNDEFEVTMNGNSFSIFITNVVDSCQASPTAQQTIAVSGTNGYSVPPANLTGKVSLTLCQ